MKKQTVIPYTIVVLVVVIVQVISCDKIDLRNSFQSKRVDSNAVLVHSFERIDFWFQSEEEHQQYITSGQYKKVNIAGIKLFSSSENDDGNGGKNSLDIKAMGRKEVSGVENGLLKNTQIVNSNENKTDTIFVSLPRWKTKVPATLSKIVERDGETRLEAFPSWEWNTIDGSRNSNETLFSVLGFEIDSKGRMWILDQGKVEEQEAVNGSIKLVIWDLNENELIHVYQFPESIASLSNSFLNDIVIDSSNDIAFISDSGIPVDKQSQSLKPAIIVYTLEDNSAKRMLDDFVSTTIDPNVWITTNGRKCFSDHPMETGVDGIALSCDFERLYWTPLTSRNLYAIETTVLMMYEPDDPSSYKYVNQSVVNLGNKIGASDGLACSSSRKLYLTDIERNGIYEIDEEEDLTYYVTQKLPSSELDLHRFIKPVVNDSSRMIWPDTIAFSSQGELYFVANNLCEWIQNSDTDHTAYIWKVNVAAGSYINGCDHKPRAFGFVEWVITIVGVSLFVLGIIAVLVIVFIMDRIAKNKPAEHYAEVDEEN